MIEFVAKLIESVSKREGGVVKHVCEGIVEAWTNWDVTPYVSVVLSDELLDLPSKSVALDLACDAIEIMRSNDPRKRVSDWVNAMATLLDLDKSWEHIDQNLVDGLASASRRLKFADLDNVPPDNAFSRSEYIKLLSRGR